MKRKDELERLIADQDNILHSNLLSLMDKISKNNATIPKGINDVIVHKAELINELNHNVKMADLTKYEVLSGTQHINTFLRLEGITNKAVIYNFMKKDSDFKSIASKVAYGSYNTLNMTKDLLKLTLNTFEEKGY